MMAMAQAINQDHLANLETRIDDAIAMAALNVEVSPSDAAAKRVWIGLRLERTINASGVDAALDELDRMESELAEGVLSPGLLDAIGWRLFRKDRRSEATAILSRNLEKFPELYIPNESMAFILNARGEQESALRILEQWLDKHPDHDRARNLLSNLRGG